MKLIALFEVSFLPLIERLLLVLMKKKLESVREQLVTLLRVLSMQRKWRRRLFNEWCCFSLLLFLSLISSLSPLILNNFIWFWTIFCRIWIILLWLWMFSSLILLLCMLLVNFVFFLLLISSPQQVVNSLQQCFAKEEEDYSTKAPKRFYLTKSNS